MANRKRTPASSGQGPTIDATSAISALQRHKQKGRRAWNLHLMRSQILLREAAGTTLRE